MGLNHYIGDDASYVEYPYVKFVADSQRSMASVQIHTVRVVVRWRRALANLGGWGWTCDVH